MVQFRDASRRLKYFKTLQRSEMQVFKTVLTSKTADLRRLRHLEFRRDDI